MQKLPYEHSYHVGNFVDVVMCKRTLSTSPTVEVLPFIWPFTLLQVKHSVQVLLLDRMKEKISPFYYVDTHAGAGCYNLR
jgi:23S rRNA A2030 N6-methylase RlmJ